MAKSVRSKRVKRNHEVLRKKRGNAAAAAHIAACAERMAKAIAAQTLPEDMVQDMEPAAAETADAMDEGKSTPSIKKQIKKKRLAKKQHILGTKITVKNKKKMLRKRF